MNVLREQTLRFMQLAAMPCGACFCVCCDSDLSSGLRDMTMPGARWCHGRTGVSREGLPTPCCRAARPGLSTIVNASTGSGTARSGGRLPRFLRVLAGSWLARPAACGSGRPTGRGGCPGRKNGLEKVACPDLVCCVSGWGRPLRLGPAGGQTGCRGHGVTAPHCALWLRGAWV